MAPISCTSPNLRRTYVRRSAHNDYANAITDSLFLTIFIIAALPVDEQDCEVHNVEVCDWRLEPRRK
jgi:hypothetical protein